MLLDSGVAPTNLVSVTNLTADIEALSATNAAQDALIADNLYATGTTNKTLIDAAIAGVVKVPRVQDFNFTIDPDKIYGSFGVSDKISLHTYNDDPNNEVVHPSVLRFDSPWNGWIYWMAYTPYSNEVAAVENVSIEVSNDGITWQVPDGLTNPIYIPPSGNTADPDLVFHNDILWVVFHDNSFAGLSSIDAAYTTTGTNWTLHTTTNILSVASGSTNQVLSPAVIVDKDNTLKMWTMNSLHDSGTNTLQMWTSIGVTNEWTFAGDCDLNESYTDTPTGELWHHEVCELGGQYIYMGCNNGYKAIYFGTSFDGLTWNLSTNNNVEGTQIINAYRPAFVPVFKDGKLQFETWYGTKSLNPDLWEFRYGFLVTDYDVETVKQNLENKFVSSLNGMGSTYYDSFNRADGAGLGDLDSGETWQNVGTLNIVDGKAGNNSSAAYPYIVTSSTNQTLQMQVSTTNGANPSLYFSLNYVSANDHIRIGQKPSEQGATIQAYTNGTLVTFAGGDSHDANNRTIAKDGDWIKASLIDGYAKYYINDTLVLEADCNGYITPTNQAGVIIFTSVPSRFDNFSAE